MAAEGRISTFPFASSLVLEFCLKVANVQLAFSFKMAGGKVAGGVLRAGKRFFSSLASLVEEKSEHFLPKKSNYVSKQMHELWSHPL